jgi:transposase
LYSFDFRKRVLAIGKKENLSIRKLGERFGIASRTIVSWNQRLSPILKRKKPPTKISYEALLKDVEQYPEAYGYERAARLGVSKTCIHASLKRLKITYKKNSQPSQSRRRKAIYVLSNSSKLQTSRATDSSS